jgi:ribosomal-protein-alanine N-acetyltransferase
MIRKARPEDADEIEALEKAWHTTPGWTRAQIADELSRADSVFLVDRDDVLLGHAVFRKELDEAHLLTIAVRPDRTKKRVGRGLMEALILEAERLGLSKMTLEVDAGNAAALALYGRLFFSEVGRRKDHYGPGRHAVLMDLAL